MSTLSNTTSNSSATICARDVVVPCPSSVLPVKQVARASGPTRRYAFQSVAKVSLGSSTASEGFVVKNTKSPAPRGRKPRRVVLPVDGFAHLIENLPAFSRDIGNGFEHARMVRSGRDCHPYG